MRLLGRESTCKDSTAHALRFWSSRTATSSKFKLILCNIDRFLDMVGDRYESTTFIGQQAST